MSDIINEAKGELYGIEQYRDSHDKNQKDFILRSETKKIIEGIDGKLKALELTTDELLDSLSSLLIKEGLSAIIKPYKRFELYIELNSKEVQQMEEQTTEEATETEETETTEETDAVEETSEDLEDSKEEEESEDEATEVSDDEETEAEETEEATDETAEAA